MSIFLFLLAYVHQPLEKLVLFDIILLSLYYHYFIIIIYLFSIYYLNLACVNVDMGIRDVFTEMIKMTVVNF